jgi:GTP-binding protein
MPIKRKNNMDKVDIIDASFMLSCAKFSQVPQNEEIPEIAFLGRSNVGKSSLLNSLVHRKGLAKSSSTPGKTRLINYFNVIFRYAGEKHKTYFVDLPGFGYAKVSKREKAIWQKELTTYITKRETIKLFIHLIDARHTSLKNDEEVVDYIMQIKSEKQVFLQVFTKIDKLNQKELSKLKKNHPQAILISNSKRTGQEKLRDIIFNILFVEKN